MTLWFRGRGPVRALLARRVGRSARGGRAGSPPAGRASTPLCRRLDLPGARQPRAGGGRVGACAGVRPRGRDGPGAPAGARFGREDGLDRDVRRPRRRCSTSCAGHGPRPSSSRASGPRKPPSPPRRRGDASRSRSCSRLVGSNALGRCRVRLPRRGLRGRGRHVRPDRLGARRGVRAPPCRREPRARRAARGGRRPAPPLRSPSIAPWARAATCGRARRCCRRPPSRRRSRRGTVGPLHFVPREQDDDVDRRERACQRLQPRRGLPPVDEDVGPFLPMAQHMSSSVRGQRVDGGLDLLVEGVPIQPLIWSEERAYRRRARSSDAARSIIRVVSRCATPPRRGVHPWSSRRMKNQPIAPGRRSVCSAFIRTPPRF